MTLKMIETPQGPKIDIDVQIVVVEKYITRLRQLTRLIVSSGNHDGDSRNVADESVAHLYDPLQPAVLRLVQFATEAALRMRMPVSVCGEMAANPRLTKLLLGLGLRSFSMNAAAVPRVKQAVRATNIDDCARFARKVMEQTDPAAIRQLVLGSAAP